MCVFVCVCVCVRACVCVCMDTCSSVHVWVQVYLSDFSSIPPETMAEISSRHIHVLILDSLL